MDLALIQDKLEEVPARSRMLLPAGSMAVDVVLFEVQAKET